MDLSNFKYMCAHAAKHNWIEGFPEESSFMVNKWRTDQENLPNLLNHQTFRRVLNKTVQEKFQGMFNVARKWHQTEIDCAEGMDVFLVEDDHLSGNFRKKAYPEYKQQRKTALKEFDVFKVLDYIGDVVFGELGLEENYGYKRVKVRDCESDDVIAVLMNRYRDYMCRIIISSDKDYLQLEGVNQYNMFGQKVVPEVKSANKVFTLTPKDFLLWKIIRGDPSDNIKGVFPGYGDIKSVPLTQDRALLKKMLLEDNSAALRFKLNKKLIDFRSIPEELRKRISEVLDAKMAEISPPEKVDFGSCIVLKG